MTLLDHTRDDSLGNDERTVQVNVDDFAEIRSRHFQHRDPLDDSRVVDQDIDHADFSFDLLNQFVDGRFIRNVADISVRRNAFFFISRQPLIDQFLVDIVEDNRRACRCEAAGNVEADTVRSTGDQSDFALQREAVHEIFHFYFSFFIRYRMS